jgi:hypothetical protein
MRLDCKVSELCSEFLRACALRVWPDFCLNLAIAIIDPPFTLEGGWNMVPREYLKLKPEIAVQAARHEFSIRLPGEKI